MSFTTCYPVVVNILNREDTNTDKLLYFTVPYEMHAKEINKMRHINPSAFGQNTKGVHIDANTNVCYQGSHQLACLCLHSGGHQ